jgi:hypothetical protein
MNGAKAPSSARRFSQHVAALHFGLHCASAPATSFTGRFTMDRRKFLATSLASAAVAAAPLGYAQASQEAGAEAGREYYELRRYHLLTPQRKLADDYFRGALVPA